MFYENCFRESGNVIPSNIPHLTFLHEGTIPNLMSYLALYLKKKKVRKSLIIL